MSNKIIKYILWDAANTLIYKPDLWSEMGNALQKNKLRVDLHQLKCNHKLLSEVIQFPDNTSKDFYAKFNSELLLSLGIIPDEKILEDIFLGCSYLPWKPFVDTAILRKIQLPMGILSNFNKNLKDTIHEKFEDIFQDIIVSENAGLRKPDPLLYRYAIKQIGLPADNILYIGDSLKLDIIPALYLGINAVLIDRENFYLGYENRITTLADIDKYII